MSGIHEHGELHPHEHGHEHGHTHGPDGEHLHGHVHSAEEKRAVLNRLSRVVGHIEAVKRMVEGDEDCSQVLIQLAAIRSAINNTGKLVLRNHVNHCIVEAVEQGDEAALAALNDAIDKFIK